LPLPLDTESVDDDANPYSHLPEYNQLVRIVSQIMLAHYMHRSYVIIARVLHSAGQEGE